MWKRKGILLCAAAFVGVLMAVSPSTAQTVYNATELSQPPKVASPSQAQMQIRQSAQSLLAQGVSGKVQVRFIVDQDGKVDPKSVQVVAATSDQLRSFAAQVVKQIRFVPGKKDGAPVKSQVMLPLTIGG